MTTPSADAAPEPIADTATPAQDEQAPAMTPSDALKITPSPIPRPPMSAGHAAAAVVEALSATVEPDEATRAIAAYAAQLAATCTVAADAGYPVPQALTLDVTGVTSVHDHIGQLAWARLYDRRPDVTTFLPRSPAVLMIGEVHGVPWTMRTALPVDEAAHPLRVTAGVPG